LTMLGMLGMLAPAVALFGAIVATGVALIVALI